MKNYAYIFLFCFLFSFCGVVVSADELENDIDTNNEIVTEDENLVDDVLEIDDTVQNQVVQQIDLSVLSNDLATINDSIVSSMEFTLVRDYAKGLLLNMSNMTDYVFFTNTVDGIRHYYLYYNLDLNENDDVIYKDYPYFDIYNIDGVYYQSSGVGSFTGYPVFAYGSFGSLSALIDNQFHFNDFYIVVIGLMIMFILFRKRVFS